MMFDGCPKEYSLGCLEEMVILSIRLGRKSVRFFCVFDVRFGGPSYNWSSGVVYTLDNKMMSQCFAGVI